MHADGIYTTSKYLILCKNAAIGYD